MFFSLFCVSIFPYSGPLRPPMWGGEPITKDPERTVAAAVRDGGDEACRGMSPSTSQQSAAEQGGMTPVEPDIDVKTMARIYHLTDDFDSEYKVTRIEIESIAALKINGERLYISHYNALEREIWDLSISDARKLVDDVENAVAEKAFKFMAIRRELLNALKEMKVEVTLEKVVSEEYFEDDYDDDP